MNIGDVAKATGVTAKMIRHYEGLGLIPAPARSEAGYRRYDADDLRTLRFIRHSRDLGFSLEQIRELLALWQDRRRPSRQVRALALAHMAEIDAKLAELGQMKAALADLVERCHGDDRPQCPILDTLAQPEAGAAPG